MKRSAACRATWRPVATLPVKQTASARSIIARPVSASPVTTRKTAASSGTRDSAACSGAMNRGVTSEGFNKTLQPAASAGALSIIASSSGTFQGLMTATTS